MNQIEESLKAILKKIEVACHIAGRKSSTIKLLAVSKRQPLEKIQNYVSLAKNHGIQVLLGENQVQEFESKSAALLASAPAGEVITTHLIGHLQSNKAKKAVELFDCIQSVDSLKLLQIIQKEAQKIDKKIAIFLQVNISEDPKKYGFLPKELPELIAIVQKNANISLEGLMTITKFFDKPEEARSDFKRMHEIRNSIDSSLQISMGMSADFDIAIEEGADIVRVGSALFGERS